MGIKHRWSEIHNKRGQAIIETAMILPLILLLICGTIEIGWLCFNQLSISDLARQGAREGIIYSAGTTDLSALESKLIEKAPDQMKEHIVVDIDYSNQYNPREGDVVVTVTYMANAITPVLGLIISGNQYQLKSTCTMKVE